MTSKQNQSINVRRVSMINGHLKVTIDSKSIDEDTLIKLISIEIENDKLRKQNERLQAEIQKLKKQDPEPNTASTSKDQDICQNTKETSQWALKFVPVKNQSNDAFFKKTGLPWHLLHKDSKVEFVNKEAKNKDLTSDEST